MIIFILLALLMLTTSQKPFNPNYDPSTAKDINWNTSDLLSFLDNIHNVPLNDITTSGKEISHYQTATKAEITAELIKTINLTHYKLLSAVKHVIDYNNILLKKSQNTNNSLDICEKKINELAAQTKRNNFLLLQMKMAHMRPDTCQAKVPRIDTNTVESTHQIINGSFIHPPVILREPQLNHNTIKSQTVSPTIDMINDASSDHLNPQLNDNTIKLSNTEKNESPTKFYSTQDSIKTSSSIKPILVPVQTIDLQTTQSNCAPVNPSAITRGQIKLINEPQSNHNTINTITTSSTTDKTDDLHINTLEEAQSKNSLTKSSVFTRDTKKIVNPQLKLKNKKNIPKIKIKKKKKRIKIKNNKRNKKNKIKQQKNKMMNKSVKNNISNSDLEQMIRNELTDDDYQDWMNTRLFDPEYTATTYYQKTYGTSAVNKIKKSHVNDQ